jgi:hypothetical protein
MKSSNQVRKIHASGMHPASTNINRRVWPCYAPLLKALAERSEPVALHAGRTNIEVDLEYRRRCNQAGVVPVSACTFYRRLRGLPGRSARPKLTQFMSVVIIDEVTFDFTINDEVSS